MLERFASILGQVRGSTEPFTLTTQRLVGTETRSQGSVEHVENTAVALSEIAGAVSRITAMTDQVAAYAQAQGASAEQIGLRIDNISQVARQAAEDAQGVKAVGDELQGIATGLQAGVTQFRL